jgi:hypothetical protein
VARKPCPTGVKDDESEFVVPYLTVDDSVAPASPQGSAAFETDKNACERRLESPALGHKNWLFGGSDDAVTAVAS